MRLIERPTAPDRSTGAERSPANDRPRANDVRGPRARSDTRLAPDLDPIALFAAARSLGFEAALWLQPDRGQSIVGIGRAWSVELDGADRFAEADRRWRELASALTAEREDRGRDTLPADPVLLGGLGFTGRTPSASSVWVPFGPSSLVLPTLVWRRRTDGQASLTVSVVPDREGDARSGANGPIDGAAADAIWDRLVDASTRPDRNTPSPTPLTVAGERPDRAAWDRLVGMFAGAVGRGRLDKVVLARRVDVASATGDGLDVIAALRHLAASAPESTLYAFSRGESTFLGATPERLVRTERRTFETVAIAGTGPRSIDPTEDARLGSALLGSEKDREEHAVVVEMLRESLAPIVDELTVAPGPRLLLLRHVQHLMTPVSGRLRDDAGLLSLAGRLHPTPAVGGQPRDLALELIAEHEGFDRGWYAGPVGWVDRDGDGELAVALRCGLVRGSGATLFAGCGIVADSDPQREWDESRIKLRAVANALGGLAETDE